jgi:hypothetical protein
MQKRHTRVVERKIIPNLMINSVERIILRLSVSEQGPQVILSEDNNLPAFQKCWKVV